MTSRRDFLAGSLLVAGAPVVHGVLAGAAAEMRRVRFVTESDCSHACRFVARLPNQVACIPADPLDYLDDFVHAIRDDACDAVFGLTRDSNQFLLTQLAAAHGFRVTYSGIHDARDGAVRHTLQGDLRTLERVALGLAVRAAAWPETLADLSATLLGASASKLRRRIASGVPAAKNGLPYLTSWTLRRV